MISLPSFSFLCIFAKDEPSAWQQIAHFRLTVSAWQDSLWVHWRRCDLKKVHETY